MPAGACTWGECWYARFEPALGREVGDNDSRHLLRRHRKRHGPVRSRIHGKVSQRDKMSAG